MKHDKCGTPDCCQECGPIQTKLNRFVQILDNIEDDQDKIRLAYGTLVKILYP